MTRTGKIARLPNNIRELLNRRLQDGEKLKNVLAWLNPLPEVQTVLKAEFEGRPISPANLTHWKNGGFREWQVAQDALNLVRNLKDADTLGHEALAGPYAAKLAQWTALHFASAAQALIVAERRPSVRWARLRELCADISRLRRGELYAERLAIDRDRLALEQSHSQKRTDEEFWKWTERPDIREKLSPNKGPGLTHEAIAEIEKALKLL
jgi:hypothetical protein